MICSIHFFGILIEKMYILGLCVFYKNVKKTRDGLIFMTENIRNPLKILKLTLDLCSRLGTTKESEWEQGRN